MRSSIFLFRHGYDEEYRSFRVVEGQIREDPGRYGDVILDNIFML